MNSTETLTANSYGFQTDEDYARFHRDMISGALEALHPDYTAVEIAFNRWDGFDLLAGNRTARLAFDDNEAEILRMTPNSMTEGRIRLAGALCTPTAIAAALAAALA